MADDYRRVGAWRMRLPGAIYVVTNYRIRRLGWDFRFLLRAPHFFFFLFIFPLEFVYLHMMMQRFIFGRVFFSVHIWGLVNYVDMRSTYIHVVT